MEIEPNEECCFELGSICVDYVRMHKDEEEIDLMRQSSLLNDQAIDQVIQLCAQGNLTEKQVAKHWMYFPVIRMQRNSFEPIVGYGANGADGHHGFDDST